MRNTYLEKHGLYGALIHEDIRPNTGMILVIPCYNEDNVLKTLESIENCKDPCCAVEIIVVINSSFTEEEEIVLKNKKTQAELQEWINSKKNGNKRFFVLNIEGIESKNAGVGMARKIGMDEAVRRFENINDQQGIIVNTDADCICEENYLCAIEKHFSLNPNTPGCSIYFEHPLSGEDFSKEIYEGITHYELFLRYHYQGLKFTGHPYIFQTVGSCMAVKNKIYQLQGGMNKRKAGEDFYFINKIAMLGGYTNLTSTTVLPSPRLSNRVPFGTGKAIYDWIMNGKITPYNPVCYDCIKEFFKDIDLCFEETSNGIKLRWQDYRDPLKTYLEKIDFLNQVKLIKKNVASLENFRQRFFKWFNPFLMMKFLNQTREHTQNHPSLYDAAHKMLNIIGLDSNTCSTKELLFKYRELEKNGGKN